MSDVPSRGSTLSRRWVLGSVLCSDQCANLIPFRPCGSAASAIHRPLHIHLLTDPVLHVVMKGNLFVAKYTHIKAAM